MMGGGFHQKEPVMRAPNHAPKFTGNRMMGQTNYREQFPKLAAGAVPGGKVNEILLESQKMIYAPPSREKSK